VRLVSPALQVCDQREHEAVRYEAAVVKGRRPLGRACVRRRPGGKRRSRRIHCEGAFLCTLAFSAAQRSQACAVFCGALQVPVGAWQTVRLPVSRFAQLGTPRVGQGGPSAAARLAQRWRLSLRVDTVYGVGSDLLISQLELWRSPPSMRPVSVMLYSCAVRSWSLTGFDAHAGNRTVQESRCSEISQRVRERVCGQLLSLRPVRTALHIMSVAA
jgi:hypothetical protein